MLPAAIIAALTTIAGLGQKAFADAEQARKNRKSEELHKQEMANQILANRTQQWGGDTSRSDFQGAENQFRRDLKASQRDTSGDWVNFANGVAGVATNLVDQAKQDDKLKPYQDVTSLTPEQQDELRRRAALYGSLA